MFVEHTLSQIHGVSQSHSVLVCLMVLRHSKCSITFRSLHCKDKYYDGWTWEIKYIPGFRTELEDSEELSVFCPWCFLSNPSDFQPCASSLILRKMEPVICSISCIAVKMKPHCIVQLAGLVSVRPDARDSKEFLLIVSLHVFAQVTNKLTCSAARRSPDVC